MPNQCLTSYRYERSCGTASHPTVRYNQFHLAYEPMLGRVSVVTDKLRLNLPVKQGFIFTSFEGLVLISQTTYSAYSKYRCVGQDNEHYTDKKDLKSAGI
jgi:hypothetical protein